jgi:LEA14-like dessication related protein
MKKTFLWIAGGAIALYFLSRYSFSKKATFYLKGIKPSGSILSPSVTIDLGVQNPTNNSVTIKSITGSVNLNGKFLSDFSAFGDQKILPNSDSVIKITAKPSAFGLFSSIKSLLNTPTGNTLVEFNGTANVEGVTYPINESISI